MEGTEEVESYASAAAARYLDAVDNTFVDQVLSLGVVSGALIDVGAGPGGIALKLARRLPCARIIGVDRSANMIRAAATSAREQGLDERVSFLIADANCLPFREECFNAVLSNSVLHHLATPVDAFNEMARLAKPGGRVIVRDLRRPSRLAFRLHVAWFGRYYSGLMKKLYVDSVHAAYTATELEALLARSRLTRARLFSHKRTHLGFVWHNTENGKAPQ